jgi:hypothetical protein
MTRKYLLIALVILPAIVFSQERRTIVISGNYGSTHHRSFCEVFTHLTSLDFVKNILHPRGNFLHELRDRIPFTKNSRSDLVYSYPRLLNFDDSKILLPNRNVLIIPDRKIFFNENRNVIILKKTGRTIYINRNGRSG